jgi:hypothetical protein
MRKRLKIGLGIAALLAVGLAIYAWVETRDTRDCQTKQQAFDQRLQEIRAKTDELKVGADKREVDELFRRVGVERAYWQDVFSRTGPVSQLAVGTMTVPTCGGLVCADRALIQITVTIDSKGKVVSKDVRPMFTCL